MICQKKPSQVGQPFVHPGQTVVQPQIRICPPWTTVCPPLTESDPGWSKCCQGLCKAPHFVLKITPVLPSKF